MPITFLCIAINIYINIYSLCKDGQFKCSGEKCSTPTPTQPPVTGKPSTTKGTTQSL